MENQKNKPMEIKVGTRLGVGLGSFHVVGGPSGPMKRFKVDYRKHIDGITIDEIYLSEEILKNLAKIEPLELKVKSETERVRYWKIQHADLEVVYQRTLKLFDRTGSENQNLNLEISKLKESLQSANNYAERVERELDQVKESAQRNEKAMKAAGDVLEKEMEQLSQIQILSHNEVVMLKRAESVWKVGFLVLAAFLVLVIGLWVYFGRP